MSSFIITTTNSVENQQVESYLGVVTSNFVAGTSIFSDIFASFSDIVGGTSGKYKGEMDKLYLRAKQEITASAQGLGANAILGYKIDFDEISGQGKSMFMISVSGTAVKLKPIEIDDTIRNFERRYDIYKKLYDLKHFVECGVITEEQYQTEKDSILLAHEDAIQLELISQQNSNNIKERERKAKKEEQVRKAQHLKEMNALLEQQRVQEEENKAKMEEDLKRQRSAQEELANAKEKFLVHVSEKYEQVKLILGLDLPDPRKDLNSLTAAQIQSASYDDTPIDPTEKMSFTIGSFIKSHKLAEACKYYIDLVNDDDITEAKSYVYSIYEIISFTKQSAFEKMALRLLELKLNDNTNQAIAEFMKYAICDQETAIKVVNLL